VGRRKLVLTKTYGTKLLLVLASTMILGSDSLRAPGAFRFPTLIVPAYAKFPYIEQVSVAVTPLYLNREGFDSNLS
jgi:hypothetical protein